MVNLFLRDVIQGVGEVRVFVPVLNRHLGINFCVADFIGNLVRNFLDDLHLAHLPSSLFPGIFNLPLNSGNICRAQFQCDFARRDERHGRDRNGERTVFLDACLDPVHEALNIISALKIEGGCNCQFALNPDSFEYAVIEVNPRVSRSSALASKATGYPIAKVAALIAVGFTLDEIPNFVTKKTKACFEPVLDYVVVKMPKFPFDKFVYAARKLGTQMKATGEVMAIGQNFEEAILKACRGLEIGVKDLNLPAFEKEGDEKIRERVRQCTDQRIFAIYQALKRGLLSVEEIHDITKIDNWFLWKVERIAKEEIVFPPKSFKMVDTCAGEFNAETPYFYSTTNGENEAEMFLKENR